MHLRPIKKPYSLLHSCEGQTGKLPYGHFFKSSTLGRRNKISILAHKSNMVFPGLKILLFLNYNSVLLWHRKILVTAIKIKIRQKLMDGETPFLYLVSLGICQREVGFIMCSLVLVCGSMVGAFYVNESFDSFLRYQR